MGFVRVAVVVVFVIAAVLPPQAADIVGPAGVRSDNLDFEISSLSLQAEAPLPADPTKPAGAAAPACKGDEASD